MATEVLMPQMGESIAEGTITRWLVAVGDTVERDQPLLEISTDKVDAEIPSPASGTLLEIRQAEGVTVPVNEIVGLIGEAGEGAAEAAAAPAEEAPVEEAPAEAAAADETPADEPTGEMTLEQRIRRFSSPLVRNIAKKEGIDLSQVAGTGRHGRVSKKDILAYVEKRDRGELPEPVAARPAVAAEAPAVEAPPVEAVEVPPVEAPAPVEAPPVEAVEVPPVEAPAPVEAPPVEAVEVPPVTAIPVEAPARVEAPAPAAPAPAAMTPPAPAAAPISAVLTPAAAAAAPGFHVPAYGPGENVTIEPMSRIRQITAAHMAYSKTTSAHVTTVFHVDMTRVAKLRQRAKASFQREVGTKLTYMPFIFKAVCGALRKFPQLNAAIDGADVVYKNDVHLGMAVAMDRGLIVPVIRHADRLSLVGLAQTANDLAERARSKKLRPDEVQAGTFTITNPGVFGSLFGTPVINQPQVGILGVGTIEKRPMAVTDAEGNDLLAIRTMSYFALTFDHRLVDGADADYFMNALKKRLQEDDWGELAPYL